MKTIGVTALALMAFGALFKIMHWPFAGPMLVLSFAFITVVFFPALLYIMYKEMNKKKQAAIYIVAFISGVTFMAGILFKIMHWSGAGATFTFGLLSITYVLIPLIMVMRIKRLTINKTVFLTGLLAIMLILTGLFLKIMHWPLGLIALIVGSILLIMVFMPLFYYKEVRNSEKFRVDFLFAIIAFIYFIAFNFLLSLPDKKASLDDLNLQDRSFRASTNSFVQLNIELENRTKNELAVKLCAKADSLCEKLEALKVQLIQNHYNFTKEDAIAYNKSNETIHDLQPVKYYTPEAENNSPFKGLKAAIDEFNVYYKQAFKDSLKQQVEISPILNTKPKYNEYLGKSLNWETTYFRDIPATEALSTLSLIQLNIRLAENIALSSLINTLKNN